MKGVPGGVLLQIHDFPPRFEVLEDLFFSLEGLGTEHIYLYPGRLFCWSFDDSLRDLNSYPEEIFRGLLSAGEKRGIPFIPVITMSQVDEFIAVHSSSVSVLSAGERTHAGVLRNILEGMLSDLVSVFDGPAVAAIAAGECDLPGPGSSLLTPEMLEEAAEALGLEILVLDGRSCRSVAAGELTDGSLQRGSVFLPVAKVPHKYELPAPPGWLYLLSGSFAETAGLFLDRYSELDRLLASSWLEVRRRWEGRRGGGDTGALFDLLKQLNRMKAELNDAASALFIPSWFDARLTDWFQALSAALMHQTASTGCRKEDIASILSLL